MSFNEAESVISRANDQEVWPWQAEPYRLWSLLDMLTAFGFGRIGSDLINFERACAFSEVVMNPPVGLSREGLLRSAIPQYQVAVARQQDSHLPSGRDEHEQLDAA